MDKKKEEYYPIFEIEVGKDRGAIGISFCPGIKDPEPSIGAVSYTHLTLPTILLV